MNSYRNVLALAVCLTFSGCAVVSGLQTYDLPEQGAYKTEQGVDISVVPLTQDTIPAITPTINSSLNRDIATLFNNSFSVHDKNR